MTGAADEVRLGRNQGAAFSAHSSEQGCQIILTHISRTSDNWA